MEVYLLDQGRSLHRASSGQRQDGVQSVQARDLAQLDGLLKALGEETDSQCKLLREHLESARVYLVGLMPAEYALSLKMADEALSGIADHNLRARVEDFIRGAEKRESR
jgi:glutamate synthase domain-containing protein 3